MITYHGIVSQLLTRIIKEQGAYIVTDVTGIWVQKQVTTPPYAPEYFKYKIWTDGTLRRYVCDTYGRTKQVYTLQINLETEAYAWILIN